MALSLPFPSLTLKLPSNCLQPVFESRQFEINVCLFDNLIYSAFSTYAYIQMRCTTLYPLTKDSHNTTTGNKPFADVINKGSTFYSVILRPLSVGPAGVELTTSRMTTRCSTMPTEPQVRCGFLLLFFLFFRTVIVHSSCKVHVCLVATN